ncbi:hypothetical protein GCM10023116_43520 [Kistimonas scapharcae]|uniref:Uncharacterized protein n=1 Tax=Kistimonas scapharcae TaxID=1036133 RepID=A0ABP8V737_9GAMM
MIAKLLGLLGGPAGMALAVLKDIVLSFISSRIIARIFWLVIDQAGERMAELWAKSKNNQLKAERAAELRRIIAEAKADYYNEPVERRKQTHDEL